MITCQICHIRNRHDVGVLFNQTAQSLNQPYTHYRCVVARFVFSDAIRFVPAEGSLKYRVIERFRGKYSIQAMCDVFEVSRSGYYGFVYPIYFFRAKTQSKCIGNFAFILFGNLPKRKELVFFMVCV